MKFFGRRLLDQLRREVELRLLHLGFGDRDLGDIPDLIGVAQLFHHEPAVHRADHDQILLAARRVLSNRDAFCFLERLGEELVRPFAALVRPEIVSAVEPDTVDLFGRQEFHDIDRTGSSLFECF